MPAGAATRTVPALAARPPVAEVVRPTVHVVWAPASALATERLVAVTALGVAAVPVSATGDAVAWPRSEEVRTPRVADALDGFVTLVTVSVTPVDAATAWPRGMVTVAPSGLTWGPPGWVPLIV